MDTIKHNYLSPAEAAKLARVSPQTVYKWLDSKLLASYRLPGSSHRRISREALRAFLAKNKMPTDLIDAK